MRPRDGSTCAHSREGARIARVVSGLAPSRRCGSGASREVALLRRVGIGTNADQHYRGVRPFEIARLARRTGLWLWSAVGGSDVVTENVTVLFTDVVGSTALA